MSAPVHDGWGMGNDRKSVGSGPSTASRAYATSDVVLAIGPLVESPGHPGGSWPPDGTRPSEGLSPARPHSADGILMLPPPSDPVSNGTIAPAITTALP